MEAKFERQQEGSVLQYSKIIYNQLIKKIFEPSNKLSRWTKIGTGKYLKV